MSLGRGVPTRTLQFHWLSLGSMTVFVPRAASFPLLLLFYHYSSASISYTRRLESFLGTEVTTKSWVSGRVSSRTRQGKLEVACWLLRLAGTLERRWACWGSDRLIFLFKLKSGIWIISVKFLNFENTQWAAMD